MDRETEEEEESIHQPDGVHRNFYYYRAVILQSCNSMLMTNTCYEKKNKPLEQEESR
jgi:hypothetical protein